MAKQARIEEIQYLRGFAFLAVVLQHAIGHYAYVPEAGLEDGAMLGVLLIAAKFAVPMFIFITGLVLFYNYQGEVKFGTFLVKRCKDIVLPYIAWSTVYAVAFGNLDPSLWLAFNEIVTDWMTGKASYHLWYVAMVIQLYVLFPLIQKGVLCIHKRTKPWQQGTAIVVLCVGYVLLTDQVNLIGDIVKQLNIPFITPLFTEYADRNALYYVAYFMVGAWAGLNYAEWKQHIVKWKAVWLSLYLLLSCVLFYKVMEGFSFDKSGKLIIHYNDTLLVQPFMAVFLFVSVFAMSIVAVKFHESANIGVRRVISFLGKHSYGAYLAHALMLTFSTYLADALFPWCNLSLRTVIAFLLCTALSVTLTVLLSKFSIGRLLIGASKPRKPTTNVAA